MVGHDPRVSAPVQKMFRISLRKRLHFTAFYALLSKLKFVTVNEVTTETDSLIQLFLRIIKFHAKNWGSLQCL